MKCVQHIGADAVSTCKSCWSWLCPDCTNVFEAPLCKPCGLKINQEEIAVLEKELIDKNTLGGLLVVCAIFVPFMTGYKLHPTQDYLVIIMYSIVILPAAFFMPYGWSYINSSKDPNTVTVHTNETLIWFIVRKYLKFALSCFLGIFVWPLRISEIRKKLANLRENVQIIKQSM